MNRLNNVKLCRSCLSAIFNGFDIFETLYEFNIYPMRPQTEVRVSEIFEQLTGINLKENDENLPKFVCLTCLERLYKAYEFFELCKISDDELKTYNINETDTTLEVAELVVNHVPTQVEDPTEDGLTSDNDIDDNDDAYSGNNDEDGDPDFEAPSQLDQDGNSSKSNEQIDKVYDCLKCNEVFSNSVKLKWHERVHEGNWSCTECDKILSTKYTFRHHMMLHMGKPFECTVCSWRYSRVSDLNRHTRIYHMAGKSFECDVCSKRFYTQSHLKSHQLSHLKKKRKKYEIRNWNTDVDVVDKNQKPHTIKSETGCKSNIQTTELREIRNFPFTATDENVFSEPRHTNLKTEDPSQFDTISKYYRCKKCFKKFRHRNNYLRHLKLLSNCQADINCRTNPQKCQYCATIMDNVAALRKHLETHLDHQPFRCKICNKNYKTWLKLAVHTRQIHLMKKKYHSKHLCTVCGRGLPSAKLLEEHYFVHQGIRNYKCEYCDRAFYTKSGLKQHSTIHTRDVLQCSECGKILADKVSLRNHLTLHFGKKFKCLICEKLFPNVSTLNRHVKVHRGERNFQCDQCSKRYMRRGHLNEHIRTVHENPRTMTCEECGMEFNHRGSLNKHYRLVHADKPVFSCNECGKSFGRKSRLTEHHKKNHKMSLEDL